MDFEAGKNFRRVFLMNPKTTTASYLTVQPHKPTVVVEVVSPSPLSGLLN
jgi:hypothetical protein